MSDYILDEIMETHIKKSLFEYLESLNQNNVAENVKNLTEINGGFVGRFDYFMPFLDESTKEKILISGCAVGTELIVAKNYGFKEIYGTEITIDYVKMAKDRLVRDISMHVDYYDGVTLPYDNNSFSMICSGHIIEHTSSPFSYFQEHMRVLKPGGFLFIEFPDRYHSIELHTGLKSYEGLPYTFRNVVLRHLAKREKRYNDILLGLKPVSIWQIVYYCILILKNRFKVKNIQIPAPGYIRMVIKKL